MDRLTSIVWFTQDLRLEDNAALDAAIARGGAVVPVYAWSPEHMISSVIPSAKKAWSPVEL